MPFAIGSDTSGSVRMPASYCGVLGMRTTHGAVPFAPSYDAVGGFAKDAAPFERVGRVLLADDAPAPLPSRLVVATDALERALPATRDALPPLLARVADEIGGALDARVLLMPSRTDLCFRWQDNAAERPCIADGRLAIIESAWGHRAGNPVHRGEDWAFVRDEVRALLAR